MAISLITEVMDWAPRTLTHREHKVLMILAEDARTDSRVIWQSLDSPQLHHRARLSRTQFYAVIAELVAKKCLKRLTPGGGGHVAKYQIPVLAPPSCVPENVTQACVPENGTQSGSVSRKTGHSVSRKLGRLALKSPVTVVDHVTPGTAEQIRDRNVGAPSQSLRDHDGSEDPSSDVQQRGIPATLQSQAADRNARAGEEAERRRQADELTEWIRQHPEAANAS